MVPCASSPGICARLRSPSKYENDAPEAEEEAVSSVKSSCTGHRCRKTKDFFVFCSGKNLLGIVSWFLLYCFTSFVSGARNKCLSTLNCLISLLLRALTWDNGFFFLLFFSEHGLCRNRVLKNSTAENISPTIDKLNKNE